MSKWIPWHGGDCPLPEDEPTAVKLRGGEIDEDGHAAGSWHWGHEGDDSDIMAYMPMSGGAL